jgi:hypothetical protein
MNGWLELEWEKFHSNIHKMIIMLTHQRKRKMKIGIQRRISQIQRKQPGILTKHPIGKKVIWTEGHM